MRLPNDGLDQTSEDDGSGPLRRVAKVPGMQIEPGRSWMMSLQAQAMDMTKAKKSLVFEGKLEA